jgi:hypothetical protein
MTETTAPAMKVPMPISFWVVAGLSLLWNLFGAYDYLMTRTRNEGYLSAMGDPKAVLAWIDTFPLWVQLCWGMGVWGAVAGSLLLLARSRFAVHAFLLSLIGAAGSLVFQATDSTVPAAFDSSARLVLPVVIVAVAAFLWQFSSRERAKGMLR